MSTAPPHDPRPPADRNHGDSAESLVPVIIILVCGIIFVVVCFIISLVFFRKHEPRMHRQGRVNGEPELLSYCSTVDSYRSRMIWDFEGSRQVQEFISRVIDNTLSLSTDLSRNVTSQERVTSQQEGLSQKIQRSIASVQRRQIEPPSSPIHSSERLYDKDSTPGTRSRGNTPDILLVPRERRLSHPLRYLPGDTLEPWDQGNHGNMLLCGCGCNVSSAENFRGSDASFWERKDRFRTNSCDHPADVYQTFVGRSTPLSDVDSNQYTLQARSSSLPCLRTDSESHSVSDSEFPASWNPSMTSQSSSEATLAQPGLYHMTVFSQSELSVNIRSCPDSPLCGATEHTLRDDGTEAVDVGAGLPQSLSTTILDLVQSAARKQGLTRDSIVRQTTD